MHAEIISIGNELIKGSTINSNATFIAKHLKEAGFTVQRITTIPDDRDIILETVGESLACASCVITTGGLGPTIDDVTRESISKLLEIPLVFDTSLANHLRAQFGEIESIENQATVLKSAEILPNPSGTAPGLVLQKGSAILILLPGVPLEMEEMMLKSVIPLLIKLFPSNQKSAETLHFFNLFESAVDPCLSILQKQFPQLEIGIYPRHGLLSVVLEGNPAEIQVAKEEILKQFSQHAYESFDGKIETAIQELFIKKGWTLSLAESCTGGAIAARLASIPGASRYFLGSIVAYSNSMKESLLNISPQLLVEKGAVSTETASCMAESIQKMTGSDFTLSVTGLAGPEGGSESHPIGTVYIGIKDFCNPSEVSLINAKGTRSAIIETTINYALSKLYIKSKNLTNRIINGRL